MHLPPLPPLVPSSPTSPKCPNYSALGAKTWQGFLLLQVHTYKAVHLFLTVHAQPISSQCKGNITICAHVSERPLVQLGSCYLGTQKETEFCPGCFYVLPQPAQNDSFKHGVGSDTATGSLIPQVAKMATLAKVPWIREKEGLLEPLHPTALVLGQP